MKVGLCKLESFPRNVWILVIEPLPPVPLLDLVSLYTCKNFFDGERGSVERARLAPACFSAFCHDLNASILDAHLTLIFYLIRALSSLAVH